MPLSNQPKDFAQLLVLLENSVCVPVEASLSPARQQEHARLCKVGQPTHGQRGVLLTTSGTTGQPRRVLIDPNRLLHSADNICQTLALSPSDRQILVSPLHHVFGLMHFLASLVSGGSLACGSTFMATRWIDWLANSGATWYAATPAIHFSILQRLRQAPPAFRHRLRFVRSSTAPLAPQHREHLQALLGVPVLEAYGMTETTSQITSNPLPPETPRPGSVGRAAGPQVALFDEQGRAVPSGSVGEVCVQGPTVMEGYEDCQEQPFRGRWLRTGDWGRMDEDGFLYLVGRQGDLIHRGGEKVSPLEVQRVLQSHPNVEQAEVFGVPHERLGQEIMATVTLLRDTTERQLLQFAALHLAEFKIPRRIAFTSQLSQGERAPAQSDLPPQLLASVIEGFRQVLELPQVAADDSFFELGGDSLLSTLLLNRLQSEIGEPISPVALFQSDTPRGLTRYLVEECQQKGKNLDLQAQDLTQDHPLSLSQERMWSLAQLLPDEPLDNSGRFLKLTGNLDPQALESDLRRVVQRHAVLRTTFHEIHGQPRQRIHPSFPSPPLLRQLDLSPLGPEAAEAEAYLIAEREAARVFELEKEALLRATLIKIDRDQWILLLMRHHLISDGWSVALLLRELEAPLPDLRLQYVDFVHWQRKQAALDLPFWRQALAGSKPTRLGPDNQPGRGFAAAYMTFHLDHELVQQLRALAASRKATLYMVLLSGFQALLSAATGDSDITLGSPNANRQRSEWEPLLGFFVNTMVLRTQVDLQQNTLELLEQTRTACTQAFAHQGLPFEELARELGPEPLFHILFVLQNSPAYIPNWPGLQVENWGPGPRTVRLDMELHFFLLETGQLEGWWVYNRSRFNESAMRARLDAYIALLHGLVTDPLCPLCDLLPATLRGTEKEAQQGVESHTSSDHLEEELRSLWSQKLGCPVGLDDLLVDLGASSLLALDLARHIESRWGHRPPLSQLLSASVRQQAQLLGHPPRTRRSLIQLKEGVGPPLYLVHPIGGGALVYQQLAQRLGPRLVYAFQALDGPGSQPGIGLVELASAYIAELRQQQPQGPYFLAGLSYGGVLAFEMAHQLQGEVTFLGLIDSYCPGFAWRSPPWPGSITNTRGPKCTLTFGSKTPPHTCRIGGWPPRRRLLGEFVTCARAWTATNLSPTPEPPPSFERSINRSR